MNDFDIKKTGVTMFKNLTGELRIKFFVALSPF